jgi:hypothetical protein
VVRTVASNLPKAGRKRVRNAPAQLEDTALRSLTREDRKHLSMDSWEPSLLRKLLSAQNRLKR